MDDCENEEPEDTEREEFDEGLNEEVEEREEMLLLDEKDEREDTDEVELPSRKDEELFCDDRELSGQTTADSHVIGSHQSGSLQHSG